MRRVAAIAVIILISIASSSASQSFEFESDGKRNYLFAKLFRCSISLKLKKLVWEFMGLKLSAGRIRCTRMLMV